MAAKEIPFCQLVEDFSIYPRHDVDQSHVLNLARALRAGAVLPPIVVDTSNRIVDGFHRSRAYQKWQGDDAPVPCEVRRYRSHAALVREAVELNSVHGRPLGSADQTKAAHMLRDAGLDDNKIAVTLSTTPEHVQKLLVRVVIVDDEPRPAKPSLWPARGEGPREVTPSQYEAHRSASGWRHGQTIRSLTRELRAGLVDVDRHRELLAELRGAVDDALLAVSA